MVNLAYDSLSDEKLSRGTLSKDVPSSSIFSFPDLCLETEAHIYATRGSNAANFSKQWKE